MEFASVIVKEFNIQNQNLHYFVAINQIRINIDKILNTTKINDEEKIVNQFFNTIEEIQDKYENSMIQFIKNKYILNKDHIFTACYYVEKAFLQDKNISKKKNIELLLYLATNRQINKSIESFGLDYSDLNSGKLVYCINSLQNNIDFINNDLMRILSAEDDELKINNQSDIKINYIKTYFEISDNQLNSVLESYGIIKKNSDLSLSTITQALYDLICEKMALLFIEKTKNT
jgi:tRNA threonylcarbamoyladenosine modification (KEOPS) complex Cgi121 subunit